jgi:hypothetical protein
MIGDIGLAAGQHRHGRVIVVQSLGCEDMRLDAPEDRLHNSADRAHLVGQGRQADRHALFGVAFGLPVQRLVLAELLERDHGQQVRTSSAARDDMEGCGRLSDGLAIAAGELFPDVLDDLTTAAG